MSSNQIKFIGLDGIVSRLHKSQPEAVELEIHIADIRSTERWWFHYKDLMICKKIIIKKEKFDIKNLVVGV